MKTKISLFRPIQLWGLVFLVGVGVTIAAIDLISTHRDFASRVEHMREDHIAFQKQNIKQEVQHVIHLVNRIKKQTDELTRTTIKTRVYEAYSIAQNIYQQNRDTKSEHEIKDMIMDALRPIRFAQGKGYYFATRLDGIEMLFADKPEMEGLNLLDMRDTRGQYVIKDMIEIAKQSGEGFYEYHWTKPNVAGNGHKKISFIKLFEPYSWFIGTGLYVDDVESQIKTDLLMAISSMRFGKEGYIFVNRFNGDALVSNGKVVTGTKKLWEVFNKDPEKTKEIFQKELDAALKPEGDFIYYSFVKLTNPDKESPKSSFIFGFPELQWLVGAGTYLDDVEADIALAQAKLNNQIKMKMLYFTLIVAVVVAFAVFLFSRMNRRVKRDFNLFVSFFNQAAISNEPINRNLVHFNELDHMAEYANQMLSDRLRSEELLREREGFYQKLLDDMVTFVAVLYPDGEVIFVNNTPLKVGGFKLKDVIGEKFYDAPWWTHTDEVRDRIIRDIEQCSRGESLVHDVQIQIADGSLMWIEYSMHPIFDDHGVVKYVIPEGRDLTERKKAEAEQERLQRELQQTQKMEAVGRLAGGIAHDFNNILGIILGYTDFALNQCAHDGQTKLVECLKHVEKAGERAKGLVSKMLAFSRTEAETNKLVWLPPLIEEDLKMLRSSLPASMEINTVIEDGLPAVLMDEVRLNQILMNLCINARDAMEGKGSITIRLGWAREVEAECTACHQQVKGDWVELSVNDTGSGIEQEVLDHIFNPFYTTKAVGKGSGMGLAVIQGIMHPQRGHILVETEVGNGSTFRLLFSPVVDGIIEAPGVDLSSMELPHGHGDKVLVLDDEPDLGKYLGDLLESYGYLATVMTDSKEALELFREKPDEFALLITDQTMPGITGVELVKALRKIRPDMPVILNTGFSDAIDAKAAVEMGIRYLEKPVNAHNLIQVVGELLNVEENSHGMPNEEQIGVTKKMKLVVLDDEPVMANLVQNVADLVGFDARVASSGREFLAGLDIEVPDVLVLDLVMPDIEGIEVMRHLVNRNIQTAIILISGYDGKYLDIATKYGAGKGLRILGSLTKPFSTGELEKMLKGVLSSD